LCEQLAQYFQPSLCGPDPPTSQKDGQTRTDRQHANADSKTALCTMHRAVKTKQQTVKQLRLVKFRVYAGIRKSL